MSGYMYIQSKRARILHALPPDSKEYQNDIGRACVCVGFGCARSSLPCEPRIHFERPHTGHQKLIGTSMQH